MSEIPKTGFVLVSLPPPPDVTYLDRFEESQRKIIEDAEKTEAAAAVVMEQMDHKNAHYAHIGKLAMGEFSDVVHRDEEGYAPGPRTFIEKRRDKRATRIGAKVKLARLDSMQREGSLRMLGGMTKKEKSRAIRKIKRSARKEHWSTQRKNDEILRIQATNPIHKRNQQVTRGLLGYNNKYRLLNAYSKYTIRKDADNPRRNARREEAIGKIQLSHAASEEALKYLRAIGRE